MKIPLLADVNKSISTDYGVLKEDEGIAYRCALGSVFTHLFDRCQGLSILDCVTEVSTHLPDCIISCMSLWLFVNKFTRVHGVSSAFAPEFTCICVHSLTFAFAGFSYYTLVCNSQMP